MKIKYFKTNRLFYLFLLFISGLFWAGFAKAENIYLEPNIYLKDGQKFYEVKAFLDTEGQKINVLAGELDYEEKDLNLEKTTYGGSIISYWAERPDRAIGGKIKFSGGIPGGLNISKGYVFSAIFTKAKDSAVSQTEINLQNLSVYLNDGKGVKKDVPEHKYVLAFDGTENGNFEADNEPPEIFAPYVYFDKYIENGKWVVFFNAQDKGTGVDHYDVYESTMKYDLDELKKMGSIDWRFSDGLKAYVLADQSLTKYIYIRATDRAGNARIAQVIPAKNQELEKGANLWLIAAILIILAIIIYNIFKKRKEKKKRKFKLDK